MNRMNFYMAVAALTSSGPALSAVLQVPQQFNTIQDAVVASQDGDTIQLGAGVYNVPVDFLGKDIVLQGAGIVPRGGKAKGLAPDIECFYFDLGSAFDFAVEVGQTQAALLGYVCALGVENPGVDQGDGQFVLLLGRYIYNYNPAQYADLRSCQADACSTLHGVEEVLNKSFDSFVDGLYGCCFAAQDLGTKFDDFEYHRRSIQASGFRSRAV